MSLTNGLIAKFKLDSTTESLNGHSGTLMNQSPATGNASFTFESPNKYLELTERGQGLVFSNTGLMDDLGITKSHSISVWVNIPQYVSDTNRVGYFGCDAASIFCKGTLSAGGNALSMALEQGYPLLWHRKPDHGAFSQATVQVQLNTWTHLLVTIEGGANENTVGTVRWYVNGQPAGEFTAHPGGWYGTTSAVSANQDIVIGGAPVTNPWAAMKFLGSIDDIRVWDRVISLTEAGQLYSEGREPADTVTYSKILGKPSSVESSLPNPHEGLIAISDLGQSYESTGLQDGTWSGPIGIPGFGNSRTDPSAAKGGNFWAVIVSGTANQYSASDHIAYANGIDANGNACFPSVNGWTQMTNDGTGVDKPRSLYDCDGNCLYMTVVNDDSMTGNYQNRLYKSNVASSSSDTLTWTQLNASASWNGQSVTNGLGAALAIKYGAAVGDKHIWVCKDQNAAAEFGSSKVVIYDMSNGQDVINSTLANVPAGVVNMGKPVYCAYSSNWYIPCKDAILSSSDGGANWSKADITYGASDNVFLKAIGASPSGTLIAVGHFVEGSTEEGIIFRSEDGTAWTATAKHTNRLLGVTSVANDQGGCWSVAGESNALGYSDTDGVGWDIIEDAENNGSESHNITSIFYGGLKLD